MLPTTFLRQGCGGFRLLTFGDISLVEAWARDFLDGAERNNLNAQVLLFFWGLGLGYVEIKQLESNGFQAMWANGLAVVPKNIKKSGDLGVDLGSQNLMYDDLYAIFGLRLMARILQQTQKKSLDEAHIHDFWNVLDALHLGIRKKCLVP